jgi:hypothetical protein
MQISLGWTVSAIQRQPTSPVPSPRQNSFRIAVGVLAEQELIGSPGVARNTTANKEQSS